MTNSRRYRWIFFMLLLGGCPGVAFSQQPRMVGASPRDGATGILKNAFISCKFELPNRKAGIDSATLAVGLRFYPTENPDAQIPFTTMLSNSMLNLVVAPSAVLESFTQYTFEVTPELKDVAGNSFAPFKIRFTTSDQNIAELGFKPERALPPVSSARPDPSLKTREQIDTRAADSIAEAALAEAEAAFEKDAPAPSPALTALPAPSPDSDTVDAADLYPSPKLPEPTLKEALSRNWPVADPVGPPVAAAPMPGTAAPVRDAPPETDSLPIKEPAPLSPAGDDPVSLPVAAPTLAEALFRTWPNPDPGSPPQPANPPPVRDTTVAEAGAVIPDPSSGLGISDPQNQPTVLSRLQLASDVSAEPSLLPVPENDLSVDTYEDLIAEQLASSFDLPAPGPRELPSRLPVQSYPYATAKEPDSLAPPRIRLGKLNAAPGEASVFVRWTSEEEYRLGHYRVERSPDGKTYEPVKIVTRAGNSDTLRSYEVEDLQPYRGTNFYRLRWVTRTKEVQYLDPVKILYEGRIPVEYLQRNVMRDSALQVRFDLASTQQVEVMVKARNNQIVKRMRGKVEAGTVEKRLSLQGVTPGEYLIGIRAEGKVFVRRIRVLY